MYQARRRVILLAMSHTATSRSTVREEHSALPPRSHLRLVASPDSASQAPVLPARARTQVCVIGAGLAGASTAWHLAKTGWQVTLVEATHAAAGASGRGTGLMGLRWGPPPDIATKRWGSAAARGLHTFSERAWTDAVQLTAEVAPQTLTQCPGQRVVARSRSARRRLARQAKAYADLGLDVGWETGQGHEIGSLWLPRAASVDPRALTLALLSAARNLEVQIFEDTPVTGVAPGSRQALDHPEVHHANGRIIADHVVVAVDGDGLGHLQGALLELQVHASLTAPLPPHVLSALGGVGSPHVIDVDPLGAYHRVTADGRIMIGGGPVVPAQRPQRRLDVVAERAWRWQRQALAILHPALRDIPIEHAWRGRITVTSDGMPLLRHDRAGGILTVGGWNGHGLVATLATGARIASLLGGTDHAPAHIPWRPGRAWPLTDPRMAGVLDALLSRKSPPAMATLHSH